jgi:methionyl-tRNA synthetase
LPCFQRVLKAVEEDEMPRFYITSPIYYVNDRPHIGHLYTTTVADVVARWHRILGDDVFFLTGTDEHAAKVADTAAAHGLAPLAWADENAAAFQQSFAAFGIANDDFIRTSQTRHTERVRAYLAALIAGGDVYRGRFEGWYDAAQEEYVPESRAAALDYRSPIGGRPLVRRAEENYFFRLSAYQDRLLRLLHERPDFVQPEARRREVIGRIEEGLNDVPISRTGSEWGIDVPGDPGHKVYVWIDALFSYLTAVDTPQRRALWPASVYLIGKEILWFHAVIWPALLMALQGLPGYEWLALPRCVYAHSFWVSGGQKMSKSLGNFVDLERLQRCVELVGLDGLRYFLAAHGPLGVADRDFNEARLLEVYMTELSNGFGNLVQRVSVLVARYAGGRVPAPCRLEHSDLALREEAGALPGTLVDAFERLDVGGAAGIIMNFVGLTNRYAEETAPWNAARAGDAERVSTALYHLAEATRLAAWCLWPFIPSSAAEAHRRLSGLEPACGLGTFGAVPPGAPVTSGPPLFPRAQAVVA